MARTHADDDGAEAAQFLERASFMKFELGCALARRRTPASSGPINFTSAILRGCGNGYPHLTRMQNSDSLQFHPSSPSLPDIFLHPAQHRFVPALAVQRAKNPVTFIRKDESFGWHTIPAERGKKLQALID